MTALDVTGHRFGRLVARERQGTDSKRVSLWFCECDCGGSVIVRISSLRDGHTVSCGCYRRERRAAAISALRLPFDESFVPEPNSGCWLWVASLNVHGYGRFWEKGRHVMAHRLMWEIHRGPIPKGLVVLHRCDTPPCVNLEHLTLGTQTENVRDMFAKGRDGNQHRRGLDVAT